MLFHVVGIKETKKKKYNMDILIKWESEKFVRSFLQHHNIIVLNLSEYKKPIEDFWKLSLIVDFQNQKVEIVSYLTDIKSAIFNFSMIWFIIKYINFTDDQKIDDTELKKLMSDTTKEVEDIKNQEDQIVKQEKEQEKKIYKDDNLEKIVEIAEKTFWQIDSLLDKVWDHVSKDKIRDLNVMKQELTKLKMWRNDDKMSELLEKIYEKSDDIETEYLEYMQQNIDYPIKDSVVTNIDIISENQKLKKAKKIKQIWAKRDAEDNYYLSFESTGLYIKFLLKDLKYRLRDLSWFFKSLFWYLELATILILIITTIILWFKRVSYVLDENLYNYVFLLKTAIFWLTIFYAKKLRKTKIYSNILLLIFAILIAIILFWFLRFNFSF